MTTSADAKLRTGMAWNLVPVVVLGVVGLGLNFAIGRWWGTAALGVFNQVTTAYFVLGALGAIGINLSALRAIAQRPEDEARVASIVVGALVPAAILAALVTLILIVGRHAIGAWLGSEDVHEALIYVAPGLACFVVNKLLLSVVNGLGRMRAFAIYTTLRYAVIGIALAVFGALGLDAVHLPMLWTVTEVVLLVALAIEMLRTIKFSAAAGWRTWVPEHLRFGIRGAGATLMFELNSRLDIWILGAAVSDSDVGIYSMAASLAEGVSQLGVALQVNVNPTIAADLALHRPGEVEALARRTRRWFVPAMIAICGLGALLFPFVIPLLTGDPSFSAGAVPFALLMAGLAIATPWLPFNQALLMGGKPGWHTIYIALIVTANVVLNVALIPYLGLEGAALGTSLAMVSSGLWLMYLSRRLLGLRL